MTTCNIVCALNIIFTNTPKQMSKYIPHNYDSNASRRDFLRQSFWLGAASISGLSSCDKKISGKSSTASSDLKFYGTGTLNIEKNWDRALSDLGFKI